ncbi:MAG: HD domain-containing protein [Lachnospiraceae bacterium]|nr:HD domain-containing protein [Lachnospiraceae bacterium]
MVILQWCKMQIMCLLILIYVGYIYMREGFLLDRVTKKSNCNRIFDAMFIFADLAVLFDGVTACTVNFTDQIPRSLNVALHFFMFLPYDIFAILLFMYWLSVTVGIPKSKWGKYGCVLPGVIAIALTIWFLPELDFIKGTYTNYSMGKSVYACFACVIIYCVLTIGLVITQYRYIPKNKTRALATTLACIIFILSLQVVFPEVLLTSVAIAMITISIYLNMENPAIHGLEHYQHEMVMGFATLVENKDDNTGGHIRRSSAYAVLIAKELRKREKYKKVITRDYLDNLEQSAPMHDIGKIGIPDAILQKPGKLTAEEFDKMKEHPVIGGTIIRDTFGHLFNGEYENMAYQVATYHHEKWNGKGYPEGLSGTDIPLCARIMAVADVFDAVSAKRCYRDAMPLGKCYGIIESGRGSDFDPDIVDAFMENRDQVEKIYYRERG